MTTLHCVIGQMIGPLGKFLSTSESSSTEIGEPFSKNYMGSLCGGQGVSWGVR
jgi:hypothetical protein